MSIRYLITILATAMLFIILLTGCQSVHQGYNSGYRGEVSFGPAHSLAMDSIDQRELNRLTRGPSQAWYLERNDLYPTIYYGSQVQTFTETQVYERDRQDISNGRVRDHFSRTTTRRTYSRSSR